MLHSSVFDDIPAYELTGTTDETKIDELIEWFRDTYPSRDDVTPRELYRAARDHIIASKDNGFGGKIACGQCGQLFKNMNAVDQHTEKTHNL